MSSTTYISNTNLNLGQVPREITDPVLYRELLDIHNAIEILLTSSDAGIGTAAEFIAKYRNNTTVVNSYLVLATDGTVLVDAAGGDIIITLPPVADVEGYRFEIKRIDTAPANTVTLVSSGLDYIDGRVNGIKVSTKSSYTVKASTTIWNIL